MLSGRTEGSPRRLMRGACACRREGAAASSRESARRRRSMRDGGDVRSAVASASRATVADDAGECAASLLPSSRARQEILDRQLFRLADPNPCPLLHELDRLDVISLLAERIVRDAEQIGRELEQRRRHLLLASDAGGDPDVLVEQREAEGAREGASQDALREE